MSYCHLVNNDYDDVTFTLGLGHPFGVDADRVPNVMSTHAAAQAGGCLDFVPGTSVVFIDGFETGNEGNWLP